MVHTIQTAAERRHYTLRRMVERFAVGAMVLCTAITVFFLFAILGYVIFKGAGAIDWQFLTQLPLPPGEDGGGIANALVGSVMVVACALLMALPIGFGAAIFVNEFPNAKLGRFVRFMAEVLTGVPSIVVGLFAYAMVVRPMGTFSGFSGSVAYAFIMVPILLITSHEGFRLVPASMREAPGTGGAQVAHDPGRGAAGFAARADNRRGSGVFPRPRRSRAGAIYRLWQFVLESQSRQAHRHRAHAHLHLCHGSLRRLAPKGLGCVFCSNDGSICYQRHDPGVFKGEDQ